MEHPHDPYHVRPFPQQPFRGGKQLLNELSDLEMVLLEKVPNLEGIREVQARIHATANQMNDDKLVDLLRQVSHHMDEYQHKPSRALREKIITAILKIRIQLKHL